jgi:plasmid stability protein
MQPSAAQKQQPSEDIDAVLSRFQSWSGSRKTSDPKDGVREVSHEEALQASRYRWQAHVPPTRVTEPDEKRDLGKRDLGPEPGVIPIPSPVPLVSPVPTVAAPAVGSFLSTLDGDLLAPDTVAFEAAVPEPRIPLAAARKSAVPPEFRAVLAETVLPDAPQTALAKTRAATGEPERQLSMTLRVAASEQALIKIRAAEAGISASAYLRQCALEVEQLRAQVKLALDIIERNATLPSSGGKLSLQQAPVGFFTRVRQAFFGGRSTALSLRA